MHEHFTFGHHSLPTEGQELLLKAQDLIILSLRSILIHLHLFLTSMYSVGTVRLVKYHIDIFGEKKNKWIL